MALTQYQSLLAAVLDGGEWVQTRQGVPALTVMQQTMRFDLADGFPCITERSLASFWRKSVGELLAFLGGARTVEELEAYGCDWWAPWASPDKTAARGLPPGDLGPGSYGGAFAAFPTSDGGSFDQVSGLVERLRAAPLDRTHFVTPWIPQYQRGALTEKGLTTIAPCHGWVHLRLMNGRLHLHMFQRSGDVPIGVPANMVQYAALTHMLALLLDCEAGQYLHTISDAHIYEPQLDAAREMLAREPRALPGLRLTAAGRDRVAVTDFRPSDFDLEGYDPHPAIRGIAVAT